MPKHKKKRGDTMTAEDNSRGTQFPPAVAKGCSLETTLNVLAEATLYLIHPRINNTTELTKNSPYWLNEIGALFQPFQSTEIRFYSHADKNIVLSGDHIPSGALAYRRGNRIIYIIGYIRFASDTEAEIAYACFNDTFLHKLPVQLLYSKFDNTVATATSTLAVDGIPSNITDWFNTVYETFRSYGIMLKCQRAHRCALHQGRGTSFSARTEAANCQEDHHAAGDHQQQVILIQYLDPADAERAQLELRGHPFFSGQFTISITPYRPPAPSEPKNASRSKNRPRSHRLTPIRGSVTDNNAKRPVLLSPTSSSVGRPTRLELKPSMDLCNLYIKHPDPLLTSAMLFNLFTPFGRIISARVMEDPATRQSRGFGFVSYSHPAEAAAALVEMDGKYVIISGEDTAIASDGGNNHGSLQQVMRVRFHEPRVSCPELDQQQQVLRLWYSAFASFFAFDAVLPSPSTANENLLATQESSPTLPGYVIYHSPYHVVSPTAPTFYYYAPSPLPPTSPPSLAYHQSSCVYQQQRVNAEWRQRIQEAVRTILSTTAKDITVPEEVIVDGLWETLDAKDLSVCLFNQDYLERQIRHYLAPPLLPLQ